MHENLTTYFAAPDRAEPSAVLRQSESVRRSSAATLADSLPYMLLMLNRQRQVVFANHAALAMVGAAGMEEVLGQRLGEMLGCVHACDMEAGCGASAFCAYCGTVKATLSSLSGKASADQGRLLRGSANGVQGLNLEVSTAPLEVDGESLTVLSAKDVSHDVRRKAMERLFFHDVLNLAGGLDGVMRAFSRELDKVDPDLSEAMSFTARSLFEEICAQKALTQAENGELMLRPESLASRSMVESVVSLYSMHSSARGREIEIASDLDDVSMISDATLLGRVLGNMLKNALEATPVSGSVVIGCDRLSEDVSFWVHNPGFIPEDVQLQIFTPSFSTKGEGRGLGTYSIKLFTESFLGGKASFASDSEEGTVFTVVLPMALESF